jgi:NAD(P)-dependent dehydrogenase (short-subunit alcohol dehydrogenase family)
VALLFGAGQVDCDYDIWGNGRATAVAYAREGAKIVAVDIDLPKAEETRSYVVDEGNECIALSANVTSRSDVEAVVQETMDRYGRIDILHNNVAINEKGGPEEASEESWDRVMDTNVKSMFITCKCVLPIMKEQSSGAIINIGSIAGVRGTGHNYISYSTSKAAVGHFTRAIALQYAPHGIRANCIHPGLMDTPRIYHITTKYYSTIEEMRKHRAVNVPMKRMGDAWDIANASVFLASDEAKYITAQELLVDGGLSGQVGGGLLESSEQ